MFPGPPILTPIRQINENSGTPDEIRLQPRLLPQRPADHQQRRRAIQLLAERLQASVNLPPPDVVQLVNALGAAVLGRQRQRVAA